MPIKKRASLGWTEGPWKEEVDLATDLLSQAKQNRDKHLDSTIRAVNQAFTDLRAQPQFFNRNEQGNTAQAFTLIGGDAVHPTIRPQAPLAVRPIM